jgi:alpha-methylacyl-CoA racemase
MTGPLTGIRIVELAGLGPAPFTGMMLADAGAEVIVVHRIEAAARAASGPNVDFANRGKRSIAVDLKTAEGVELVLALVGTADGFMEGFRPGVAERLGVGPAECLARNPRVVYGRMTGWGQDGPLAQAGGHDIDFIALTGALDSFGRVGQAPVPPLNLVADFGGGGMLLAFGMLAALVNAQRTGQGQVVDAAMADGVALLMTMDYSLRASGFPIGERGTNILDSGAPFYEVYETIDGKYVAVGAVEPKFYSNLVALLGLDESALPPQMDRRGWPQTKLKFAEVFAQRTRDDWAALFAGTDACAVPVLSPIEAFSHPHLVARGTYTEVDGLTQPAPAPRFSATPGEIRRGPIRPGEDSDEALTDWGIPPDAVAALRANGTIL